MKHVKYITLLFCLLFSGSVLAVDLTAEEVAAAEAEYQAQMEQQRQQELANQAFMRDLEAEMQLMEEQAAAEEAAVTP